MIAHHKYKCLIWISLFIILLNACSREKGLQESIRLYQEGLYQTSYVRLKSALIQSSTIRSLKCTDCIFTQYAIFLRNDSLTMAYPSQRAIMNNGKIVSAYYSIDEDIGAVTDGISVYIWKGDEKDTIALPHATMAKAVCVYKTIVYIVSEKELYIYSTENKTLQKLSTLTINPPDSMKYYNAYCEVYNDLISVVVGIAGVYYVWIIDKNGVPRIGPIQMASWKHYLLPPKMYIIKGGAGSWDFLCIDINTKQEEKIVHFSTLKDIHFTKYGAMFTSEDVSHVYFYTGNVYSVSFSFSIRGGTDSTMVIEDSSSYLLDAEKFFDKLNYFFDQTQCCRVM